MSGKDELIIGAIKIARKEVLDLLECVYGTSPQWPAVRKKILNIFGKRGLEKEFQDLEQDCKFSNFSN